MSRFGAKTYTRKQPECGISPQLDQIVLDRGGDGRATSAKMSVAAVHRWGITSFTSLRKAQVNGQADSGGTANHSAPEAVGSPSPETDPFSFDADGHAAAPASADGSSVSATASGQEKPAVTKPKKFFKSRNVNPSPGASSLASCTTAQAVAQFDRLKASASTFVTVAYKDAVAAPIPEDRVDFRCVKLEKALSKDPGRQGTKPAPSYPDRTPLGSPAGSSPDARVVAVEIPVAAIPIVAAANISVVVEGDASPGSATHAPAVRTHSRKRSPDSHVHRQAKRAQVECEDDASPARADVPSSATEERQERASSAETSPCALSTGSNGAGPSDLGGPREEASPGGPEACPAASEDAGSPPDVGSSRESDAQSTVQSRAAKTFYKSRRIFQSPSKPKAVYKMRHWHMPDSEDGEEEEAEEQGVARSSLADEFEEELFEETSLTKEVQQPNRPWKEAVVSVKCPKKVRELYTVVRNVKQAYQCHESGETQEFNDDIEYLLEGVQPGNPIAARCLSVVGLASKCMVPAFRMHLRAHGIASQFFSALADAPSDPGLSLCTATLFFVLSQDRLTMDLDASTLSLMLQLFESDPQQPEGSSPRRGGCPVSDAKHRDKVQLLCVQMQQKGNAKHLNLNHVNTGMLALETLLSLTSRKAGEWFKEELRLQGGLDHIVNTVNDCLLHLGEAGNIVREPTEFLLEKLRKIDRCSRVLENVTYMNAENQEYLLKYKDSLVVESYIRLLMLCSSSLLVHGVALPEGKVPENQTTSVLLQNLQGPGAAFFSCLLSVLRVLLNITHESEEGSGLVGGRPGLLGAVLLCILQVPRAVPSELRFDLLVLSLGLLINMVEHCQENRARMVDTQTVGWFESVCDDMEMPVFGALMDLFADKMEAANQTEEQADQVLSSREQKVNAMQQELRDSEGGQATSQVAEADDLEETIMKTLQKAGKHMEHSIICAYIALLLGCIIQNNKEFAEKLKECTTDGTFVPLVESLKRFHNFINLSGVLGNTATRSIQRVIEVLETS